MVDHIAGWFKIIQYDNKSSITIAKLVETTCLTRYPSSINPTSNVISEIIHSVLGNPVWTYNVQETYVDKDDPWLVILASASLTVHSTLNILKFWTLLQLTFSVILFS